MAKLILYSIVLVSIAVPIYLAPRPSPRRALKRVQWIIVVFAIVWAFMSIVWYPALVSLE